MPVGLPAAGPCQCHWSWWVYLPLPRSLPLSMSPSLAMSLMALPAAATDAATATATATVTGHTTTYCTAHRRAQHTAHTYASRSLRLRHRRKRQVSQPTKADAAETWMFLGKGGERG